MAKTAHKIVTTEADIDAAIARAALEPPHQAVAPTYDAGDDLITIRFADGAELRVPRRLVQRLQHATPVQLRRIEIEGSGTAGVCPALGVATWVPALIA